MGFYLNTSCVGNIVWMHDLDSNEKYGEKARLELHKSVASCFEQIQVAAPHKTATLRPLASHLTNHPINTNKTRRLQMEQ